MLFQIASVAEAFSAQVTHEGLLTCVDASHVHPEVGFAAEALAALSARVRPFARVNTLVHRQVELLVERPAAQRADERTLARVHSLVDDELAHGGERSAAVGTVQRRLILSG